MELKPNQNNEMSYIAEYKWMYYGGMSVSVLWWDVSECIMVGCQWYIMVGCQ